jgi:chromosome segregation ATPase
LNDEQLLQLCQTLAVENKGLKAGMQWLAASRDAANVSSKEEAARQAAVIAQIQADNASQAATVSCLKKQASDLQQQLGSAQYEAGKWKASFAALKTQAMAKYAALAQESEAVIDDWAAHSKELQQQAEKAAATHAALCTRCAELTSQLSSLAALKSDHKSLLTSSEQLLGERLGRRDTTISKQRLQLQQLRGATGNTAAASNEHGTATAAAEFTPAAAAAAQKMHRRHERSGYRKCQATPRTLTKSRLSACSSAATAVDSTMPATRFSATNG